MPVKSPASMDNSCQPRDALRARLNGSRGSEQACADFQAGRGSVVSLFTRAEVPQVSTAGTCCGVLAEREVHLSSRRHTAEVLEACVPLRQRTAAFMEARLPLHQRSAPHLDAHVQACQRTVSFLEAYFLFRHDTAAYREACLLFGPRTAVVLETRLLSRQRVPVLLEARLLVVVKLLPLLEACLSLPQRAVVVPEARLLLVVKHLLPRGQRLQVRRRRLRERKNRLQELEACLQTLELRLPAALTSCQRQNLPHQGLCGTLDYEADFLGLHRDRSMDRPALHVGQPQPQCYLGRRQRTRR